MVYWTTSNQIHTNQIYCYRKESNHIGPDQAGTNRHPFSKIKACRIEDIEQDKTTENDAEIEAKSIFLELSQLSTEI
jgi:hypothetical protein